MPFTTDRRTAFCDDAINTSAPPFVYPEVHFSVKRFLLFLLAAAMLCVSSPVGAEYKNYQLTVADPYGETFIHPLDAHNVIVRVRCYRENDAPWHVTWYRDGQPFRDLPGTGESLDHLEAELFIPKPSGWDGEHVDLSYRVLTGKAEESWGLYGKTISPDCMKSYFARWTEDGLSDAAPAPESWEGTYSNGQFTVYDEGETWRIRTGEKEFSIPRDSGDERVVGCWPAGPEMFIMKLQSPSGGSFAACVDKGQVRYKTQLPQAENIEGRILLPDPRGGFFIMEGYRPGNYEPAYLSHYGADGQPDRRMTLSGKNVVVNPITSAIDPDSGRFILYGSAVANSRKVYTVFALTLDDSLETTGLDVRTIRKEYGDYDPAIHTAPDGTAWVHISDLSGSYKNWPVLIPFGQLKKSTKNYGITLR